jgi:hypothetical protein
MFNLDWSSHVCAWGQVNYCPEPFENDRRRYKRSASDRTSCSGRIGSTCLMMRESSYDVGLTMLLKAFQEPRLIQLELFVALLRATSSRSAKAVSSPSRAKSAIN